MKTLLCKLILSCLAPAPAGMPVDDLRYGMVLYSYYQQDYSQALVDTLVAEARDQRGEDVIRFELAKGTFAFADGMYKYASDTFSALDEAELTDLDRMRLSFHLAREYFRREAWDKVEEHVANIDLGKTWLGRKRFHPEVEFMRAELATYRGVFDESVAALDRLGERDPLRAYGMYNLGIAMRASGELTGAETVFTELAEMQADTDEALDLIDRSKLALSFLKRELDAPSDAEAVLKNLPATGRYRELALATYGGMAMEQEDWGLSARIWMTLQNDAYWTPSTATARLGYPVSLEHLSSDTLALAAYRVAETSFSERLATLERLSGEAEDPQWVADLLYAFSADKRDPNEVRRMMAHWREVLGHTNWLEWLSTEDVHKLLVQWRVLTEMQGWLDGLPQALAVFEEIAYEQKRRAQTAREIMTGEQIKDQREQIENDLASAQARLDHFQSMAPTPTASWMMKLARQEETQIIEDLAQMRHIVERGVPAGNQHRWLDRIDRLEGVVFWQLIEESPVRKRALDKKLNEAGALAGNANQSMSRIASAERAFIEEVETDYVDFRDRALGLVDGVASALLHRQDMLARELREGMRREMEQTRGHLLIARIAIARATDKLAMADAP